METLARDVANNPIYTYGRSPAPGPVDDKHLVRRCAAAFEASSRDFVGHGTSFWQQFEPKHHDIKNAIETEDYQQLGHLLRNPAQTELFWGFDDLTRTFAAIHDTTPEASRSHARSIYNSLVQTAMGVGTIRINYAEAQQPPPEPPEPPVDDLLDAFEHQLGCSLIFPNPFADEFGISTSRGIISTRATQALYQASRIKDLCNLIGGSRVLEIGAGLGRNAYFANLFGIKNYTIVDIPSTQLAQGYYLGRLLGPDHVSLCGEPDCGVRLRSPRWLFESDETFHVILNADSLTEMDREHALRYLEFAKDRCDAFLSINHETNESTARQLMLEASMKIVHRSPYWPRGGYVEELYLRKFSEPPIGPLSLKRFWRLVRGQS
jgi:hypothetical protein